MESSRKKIEIHCQIVQLSNTKAPKHPLVKTSACSVCSSISQEKKDKNQQNVNSCVSAWACVITNIDFHCNKCRIRGIILDK